MTDTSLRDLDIFADYFFRDTLELYDWCNGMTKAGSTDFGAQDSEIPGKSRRFFYFFPRFERVTTESKISPNGLEVLSMDKVMQFFLEKNQPLIKSEDLATLLKCNEQEKFSNFI